MSVGLIVEKASGETVSCARDASVHDAARLLAEHRIGALPVMEAGRVAGIFSERDLLYCIARDGESVLGRTVGEVMTSPAITVAPDTAVLEALDMMTKRRIRHLPVVDGHGTMIGFVSIGDLVKHRMEKIESERQHLRTYIAS